MKITRAWKTELDPTEKQKEILRRCAGAARFVYNWGLAQRIKVYREEGESLSFFTQQKLLNECKTEEFPWLSKLSRGIYSLALRNLDSAFQNFFRRITNGEKPGFPKFKAKHRTMPAFQIRTDSIKVGSAKVRLPKIGWVRLKERDYLPAENEVKYVFATISERAGRWFIALTGEEEQEDEVAQGKPIGVDVGISAMATCSDGRSFDNPKALSKLERKLARAQRQLSRRQKGSNRRQRAKEKVAKIHYRISCARSNALHNTTSAIVGKGLPAEQRPSSIGIEDLNVKGMMKNHHLAKAVADVSMGELHRQLTYKAEWAGSKVVQADRFYPSTKTCSVCGAVKESMSLSERTFKCESCGASLNRDLNAAINLAVLADMQSDRINARRGVKDSEKSERKARKRSAKLPKSNQGKRQQDVPVTAFAGAPL
jgi:putative transposase